jgi:hypothetical protein
MCIERNRYQAVKRTLPHHGVTSDHSPVTGSTATGMLRPSSAIRNVVYPASIRVT